MKLSKLANLFYKKSQDAQQQTVSPEEMQNFTNYVILLNKESKTFYDYIVNLLDNNLYNRSEMKNYAKSLNNFAITMTGQAQSNQPYTTLNATYQNILNQWNRITRDYFTRDWYRTNNYEPMEKMEEAIVFIGRFLEKLKTSGATDQSTQAEQIAENILQN